MGCDQESNRRFRGESKSAEAESLFVIFHSGAEHIRDSGEQKRKLLRRCQEPTLSSKMIIHERE